MSLIVDWYSVIMHVAHFAVFYALLCLQDEGLQDNTFYIFNHVDIVIEFHRKMSDWGGHVPEDAGRIVRAKLTPKRWVLMLCILNIYLVIVSTNAAAAIVILWLADWFCGHHELSWETLADSWSME